MQSEIRKDYIQEKYVIIAPKRGKRPQELKSPAVCSRPQREKSCVFCPSKINKIKALLTIGDPKHWQVKVIKNKFPAVALDNPKAYGTQEIVIETPDHKLEMDDLSPEHIKLIFDAYARRTKEISKNKKIEYILIFKNNGGRAGASLLHSHSQIFATRFLPPHLIDKSQKVQEHKIKTGRCVYCDVIKKESRSNRLVYKDKYIIVFTPYASIHNYEIWILPQRHIDNITLLNYEEKMAWAKILKHILNKINKLCLPYNFYFHQVIHDEDQHLYMKIVPRGSVWAGVEIGSGLIINPISPESAAKFYRKGLKKFINS